MKMKLLFMATLVACSLLVGAPAYAGEKVNINTATVEELQAVKGIGTKTAEAIIAYRNEHGAYQKVDDLEHVKGIGEKSLKKFEDDLTVGTASHKKEKHD
jgi:competence protein ComEA